MPWRARSRQVASALARSQNHRPGPTGARSQFGGTVNGNRTQTAPKLGRSHRGGR